MGAVAFEADVSWTLGTVCILVVGEGFVSPLVGAVEATAHESVLPSYPSGEVGRATATEGISRKWEKAASGMPTTWPREQRR